MNRLFVSAIAIGGFATVASAGSVNVQLDFDEAPLALGEVLDDQFLNSHFIDFNESAHAIDVLGDPEALVTGWFLATGELHMTAAPGYTFSNFVFDLEVHAGQTVTVEFFSNGVLLQSATFADDFFPLGGTLFDGIDVFSGLTGIDEIKIYDSGLTFKVDDLNYTVTGAPLPHAGGLGLAGMAILAGVRRRR